MATIGVFQSADYAHYSAFTAAFQAAGHTIKDMTSITGATQVPPGSIQLAMFLAGGGNVANEQLARDLFHLYQIPIITQGSPDTGLPMVSATANCCGGSPGSYGSVVPATADPLSSGWIAEPGGSWGWPGTTTYVAALAPGTVVLGQTQASAPMGVVPMYWIESSGQVFWIHYAPQPVPDSFLLAALATYATSIIEPGGTGTPPPATCTVTADCPTGQSCVGGVCVVASPPAGGGSCTLFGIPCWLAALLGLGAVYLLSGGRKGERHGGGGHRVAHHAARIRTVVREKRVVVHRRPTLHEASERLIRRRRELHR